MHHVFWFAAGKVAGRSGPSKDPWDPFALRAAGIGAVLSVNDGALCHPDDLERAGLTYSCVPLSPNAPPQDGDLELCVAALPNALERILQAESNGVATLVHCHSGKDRTGLVLAYYAARAWRMTRHEAIAKVRHVRPIAFSAPGWEEFALHVLAATGA
jgi:protein-tyrosine phosphatase